MGEYKTTTRDCKTRYVHRLVWEDNNGEIPKSNIVHHINGDKKDNRIENLQCLSRSEHRTKHLSIRLAE